MSESRYLIDEGIVVRRTPLPSGDVVVTLLTQEGAWRAVVRKGRLPGGNPGRLSLFHDVHVQSYRRRPGDLAVITQVRLRGALARLADPVVYPLAHLLAELAERLAVHDATSAPIHAWFASGLRGLDRDDDPERVALVHAWMLLRVAGLAPAVSDDEVEVGGLRFDVAAGRLARSGEGLAVPEAAASGLLALLRGRAQEALLHPLPMRAAQWNLLARYLAWHVEPLKSLAWVAPDALNPAAAPAVAAKRTVGELR